MKNKDNKIIKSMRLDPEVIAKIQRKATEQHRSFSNMVELILMNAK